jgi:hypothetical protein
MTTTTSTVRPRLARLFIEAMAKHLPPSASTLRLLDINGFTGKTLSQLRQDLDIVEVSGDPETWEIEPQSMDAVVVLGQASNDPLLVASLAALRPGGRLILMETSGNPDELRVQTMEKAGFTRILVGTGIECPLPTGVLMRGERPHTTDDTLKRVQVAAAQDEAQPFADYRGKYVYLLVTQTPNKPVWSRGANEAVQWQAITLNGALLAFSSLPKAVGFMQPAVLAGSIQDVNKVGKFGLATARTWAQPVLLNPEIDVLQSGTVGRIDVDASTAEAPDE